MPFPPKKAAQDEEDEELSASESESTSDAPPSKMKGAKPNPLRRWAEQAEY